MALSRDRQAVITARYMTRQDRLAHLGGRALIEAWKEIPGFDEDNIADFRRLAMPRISGLLDRASSLSAAHLSLILEEPIATPGTVVEPDWRGPFTHFWRSIGNGEQFDAANAAGESQANAAGRDAVVSSARQAGDAASSTQITGWRRVLDADPCPWCITIARAVYKTATTADFGHSRCQCGVAPITR